ncbi:hypothetical protein E3Q18_03386 [Wallemia mellicola]|uniref:Uncharacterized protein n=1 Tax=Wallemia mellicola TaxID=1708541 RepID=A0A4V4MS77_9BASI|nr:hypothetical protein E3Q19_03275 [Wallemia mellicola]TIB95986.1 hypothetical protein E3Q18_03386 [Wallemia mellicola]TIC09723.1 hypothetical protein E3Q15_03378 [Wallemia mellicola]TIC21243.1 hypothetical protein E3Q12_03596 [Wallemia mellicola]TIC26233.1 hypothetical protein E3Q11_03143 [Wallemia mellicola]
MSTARLAEIARDPTKARELAGKLARLAERRKVEHARKQEEIRQRDQDNSEAGTAIEQTRKLIQERKSELLQARILLFYYTVNLETELYDQYRKIPPLEVEEGDDDETIKAKRFDRIKLLEDLEQSALYTDESDYEEEDSDAEENFIETELRFEGELLDNIEQYKKLIPRLDADLDQARAELRREKQLREESSDMAAGVKARADEVISKAGGLSPAKLLRDMADNLMNIENDNKDLRKEINRILEGYYDDMDEDDHNEAVEDIRRYFKPEKNADQTEAERRHQFHSLINELKNAALETPADPYILATSHTRSIALMLLRSGIASEHPNDARKLRLTEFHKSFEESSSESDSEDENESDGNNNEERSSLTNGSANRSSST